MQALRGGLLVATALLAVISFDASPAASLSAATSQGACGDEPCPPPSVTNDDAVADLQTQEVPDRGGTNLVAVVAAVGGALSLLTVAARRSQE